MKTITLSEFTENLTEVISEVTEAGEIVRVETPGKINFVLMDENEYNIHREALTAMFSLTASENPENLLKMLHNQEF